MTSSAEFRKAVAPILAEIAAKMRIERELGRRIEPIWMSPVIRANDRPGFVIFPNI